MSMCITFLAFKANANLSPRACEDNNLLKEYVSSGTLKSNLLLSVICKNKPDLRQENVSSVCPLVQNVAFHLLKNIRKTKY